MNHRKSSVEVTVPILGLLGILFVGLKLTGHIDWSWWWVTAPFWGPPALVIGIMLLFVAGYFIFVVVAALIMVVEHHSNLRKAKKGRMSKEEVMSVHEKRRKTASKILNIKFKD